VRGFRADDVPVLLGAHRADREVVAVGVEQRQCVLAGGDGFVEHQCDHRWCGRDRGVGDRAPLLGAVYGLGWTPCLGPTLAGVIALAGGTQVGPTTWRGLLLITAYCLGLELPFIALALGARWAVETTGWIRRHIRRIQQLGGVLLIVIALVTGLWGEVIAWLRGPISGLTVPKTSGEHCSCARCPFRGASAPGWTARGISDYGKDSTGYGEACAFFDH
jgi:hypothetical protein